VLTPEERLLARSSARRRRTCGRLAHVPPGISGTVVDVKVLSRKGVEKDERAKAIEDDEVARLRKTSRTDPDHRRGAGRQDPRAPGRPRRRQGREVARGAG